MATAGFKPAAPRRRLGPIGNSVSNVFERRMFFDRRPPVVSPPAEPALATKGPSSGRIVRGVVRADRMRGRDTGMMDRRIIGATARGSLRHAHRILRLLSLLLVSTVGLGLVQTTGETSMEDDPEPKERVVFRHFV